MNKKTLLIISIVGVIIIFIIGFFIWSRKDSQGVNPILNFLPFGKPNEDVTPGPIAPPNNQTENVEVGVVSGNLPGLEKISDGPVSGSTIFTTGSTTLVRYVDRATGNVYEYNTLNKNRVRVSNTTITKVVNSVWGAEGSSLLFQSMKNGEVENYFANLTPTSSSTTENRPLIGNLLDSDIFSFKFSPKKDQTFFLVNTAFGVDGYLADKQGGKPRKIWQSRIHEWIPQWPTADVVYLNTKASHNQSGFLFSLNLKTGAFVPILSDIPGLTTLVSPDGKTILYSESKGNNLRFVAYLVSEKTTTPTPFTTLPEKCSWTSNNTYICGVPTSNTIGDLPDAWYKGLISFNDFIQTGTVGVPSSQINAPIELKDQNGQGMDVINPIVSSDGTLFVFENKKDMSLWILPIDQQQ